MPRNLSVRLGNVTQLPVSRNALYSAIDAELRTCDVSVSRSAPWIGPALGAAFSAALLLPNAASAATIMVNSANWAAADDGECTLLEALASAGNNAASGATAGECVAGDPGLDEIQFDASLIGSTINVSDESTVPAGEPLNIVGPGTRDQLTLDGDGKYRLLNASDDVSISNLTAQNFYAAGDGGAIVSSASVSVNNSRFYNNEAYGGNGGAIRAPSITVSNSVFTANFNSDGYGGAISTDIASITDSQFYGNVGDRYGGAVDAFYQATVSGSTFIDNRSKYSSGGAIATGNANISGDSVFAYNQSDATGGAVFAFYGGTISDSSFAYNESGLGGAVFAGSPYSGVGELQGQSRRFGNAKRAKGISGLNLSISGSQFDRNVAYGGGSRPSLGGAIAAIPFIGYSNVISVSGSSLSYNEARFSLGPPPLATGQTTGKLGPGGKYNLGLGGGLMVGQFSYGPAATIAGQNDGKVAPVVDVTVDIDSTTFDHNLAFVGGGAMVMASTVTVDDSGFDNNGALYMGGGGAFLPAVKYDIASSSLAFGNTTFDNNRSMIVAAGVMAMSNTVSGDGLDLTNNETALHPGLYSVLAPSTLTSISAADKSAKGSPRQTCGFDTNYGIAGGGMLIGLTSVQLTGGSQITGNCGREQIGGVGVMGGKYSGTPGSVVVAADTVVSNNRSYVGSPGMAVGVYESGGTGSIGGSFTNNTVVGDIEGSGGGLTLSAAYETSISVQQASITGNQAANGGGIAITTTSGGSGSLGSISISDSTISGNTAVQGAGVSIHPTYFGGTAPLASSAVRFPQLRHKLASLGIELPVISGKQRDAGTAKGTFSPVNVLIQNTTIDGNTTSSTTTTITEQGGGLFSNAYAVLAMDHVTITGNSSGGDGGGVMLAGITPTVSNSIIGLNTATGTGNDANGTLDIDFSLVQDSTGATLNGANNLTGSDPLLDPLTDNGGPTFTRLPQFGSPVVDSGDPAFNVAGLPDDQRGSGFPRDAGGRTDMGAVEGITPVNVVSLAISPAAFSEGTSATMTVTLDGTTSNDVLVTIGYAGTAILGTDFNSGDADGVAAGIQILVPSGLTTGSITLDAIADSLFEGDEPFSADVTGADFALVPSPVSTNGSILDGDVLTFSIADASGPENIGNLNFNVSLNVPSTTAVSVDAITVDGTALAGADYTAVSTTVNFPAGSTMQSVSVPITNDAVAEPAETFAVNLSNPSIGSIADANATGAITDDEAAPTASLILTPPSNPEGGGSFMVTVNLSGPSSGPVVITLGFGGSAAFGVDYSVEDQDPGTPGIQIIIPAGATSGSVLITPLTDGEDEPDEDIIVSIASAVGAGTGGSPGTGTITNVAAPGGPAAIQAPALIPTLNEWMLMLLGLLLPAAVMVKLRGGRKDGKLKA